MATHARLCPSQRSVQRWVRSSLVRARPAWQTGAASALRDCSSLSSVFRVFLFSPPLSQKLFLKSVSCQLNSVQSGRDIAQPGCFPCQRSGRPLTPVGFWTCLDHWRPVGSLPASPSRHPREGPREVLLPQECGEPQMSNPPECVFPAKGCPLPKNQEADGGVSVLLHCSEKLSRLCGTVRMPARV